MVLKAYLQQHLYIGQRKQNVQTQDIDNYLRHHGIPWQQSLCHNAHVVRHDANNTNTLRHTSAYWVGILDTYVIVRGVLGNKI